MRSALRLRRATLADARFLFRLRNDPETRAASFHTDDLRFADHVAWLTARLRDQRHATRIFIAIDQRGTRVGQVRLDWQPGLERPEIGVAIAPAHRGRGFCTAILRAAVKKVHPLPILARIRPDNEASLRAFRRAGFRRSGAARKLPAPHVVLLYDPRPR